MQAVDTNVLARFILADDRAQHEIARETIAGGALVSLTVLLETAWLFGSFYARSRAQIADYLKTLIAMECVTVPDAAGVAWALDRYRAGADLEDMLHVVAAREAGTFATFDQAVARRAGAEAPAQVVTLGS